MHRMHAARNSPFPTRATRREVIKLVWLHVIDLALKFAFRLSFEQLVSLFVDYLKAMRITSLIHQVPTQSG